MTNVVKGKWVGAHELGDIGDELAALMKRHEVQGFACLVVEKDRTMRTIWDTRAADDPWAIEGRLAALAINAANELTSDEDESQ